MVDAVRDALDSRLLNELQVAFPLAERPFKEIGRNLDISETEAVSRTARLKADGLIRRISAIIEWRRLGYHSTLIALSLPEERLDEAAAVISRHPGVSHNYSRQSNAGASGNGLDFNLWFTLMVPPAADLDGEADSLARRAGARAMLNLPATRVFKIAANFNMVDSSSPVLPVSGDGKGAPLDSRVVVSPEDRAVLRLLCTDLPLVEGPFDALAEQAGLPIGEFLERAKSLVEDGAIRRYAAVLHHRKAGFMANGLTCWRVPADRVEAIGAKVASFPMVSHCYERKVSNGWSYNLFAMLHALTYDGCRAAAGEISKATGISDYLLLFSAREYKKERVRYI